MIIVVGAGLTGCTAARILADAGSKVEIWEKTDKIGGAAYDYKGPFGTYVHEYGPHIFHTYDEIVFEFLSRFTEWSDYTHTVLGNINGKLCPIPFNFESIDRCFSHTDAELYKAKLTDAIGNGRTTTVGQLQASSDADLRILGKYVYENVFLNYTKKQWGIPPEELGEKVMSRVPVRASYDNCYFSDRYQKMPKYGYTRMIEGMINHKSIALKKETDALEHLSFEKNQMFLNGIPYDGSVIYTGSLDVLLKNKFGTLPYRSLRFKFEDHNYPFQPVAVVNYPNEHEYTRITEFSHFYPGSFIEKSTILYEYPIPYQRNSGENPYYPIPLADNESLYKRYRDEISACNTLFPAGRLGNYKYINMDMAVLDGIQAANAILKGEYK